MIILTQLSTIATGIPLLRWIYNFTCAPNPTPPHPTIWQPRHNPTEWIYTDGSLKTGKPQLGASIIQSPTFITTYIDASGQYETHTITRAELVAIYVALDKYEKDNWIGIFTNLQTSLHAIQNQLQRSSHTTYHHHNPLQTAINRYRESLNLPKN